MENGDKGLPMTVFEAIQLRRSIRAFQSKPVEREKIDRLIEVARLSPSARNMQERKFIIVQKREIREKLMKAAKNQTFIAQAPVVIVACGTIVDYVMSCGQLSYPIDVAIAMDHMTLQAMEEGLGTCWVCAFDEALVKSILHIPEGLRVVALLPTGYPAESAQPRPRKRSDEIVCYEVFTQETVDPA